MIIEKSWITSIMSAFTDSDNFPSIIISTFNSVTGARVGKSTLIGRWLTELDTKY